MGHFQNLSKFHKQYSEKKNLNLNFLKVLYFNKQIPELHKQYFNKKILSTFSKNSILCSRSKQVKNNTLFNKYSSIVTLKTSKLITIVIKMSLILILRQRCETHVFRVCLCFGRNKNQKWRLLLKSSAMKDKCYVLLLCLGYPKETGENNTHLLFKKS